MRRPAKFAQVWKVALWIMFEKKFSKNARKTYWKLHTNVLNDRKIAFKLEKKIKQLKKPSHEGIHCSIKNCEVCASRKWRSKHMLQWNCSILKIRRWRRNVSATLSGFALLRRPWSMLKNIGNKNCTHTIWMCTLPLEVGNQPNLTDAVFPDSNISLKGDSEDEQ